MEHKESASQEISALRNEGEIAHSGFLSKSQKALTARLNAASMAATLRSALARDVFRGENSAVVFYDLSRLDVVLDTLKMAFPPTALHAVAVKANPLIEILKRVCSKGHGAEVASLGELRLAQAAGFPVDKIIFDSPAKTVEELVRALDLGVTINANSLSEIDRIAKLVEDQHSNSRVGIRINPETGEGTIAATSVAVKGSKFGVSLQENRTTLARTLHQYPWLTGIHLHIGSQGMSRDQLLEGVRAVCDFFLEVRESAEIDFFDVGGGLPAQYRESDTPTQFSDYVTALRKLCPALFDPQISLITEFGRAVHASCGWVASKVEYVVDHEDGTSTLFVHVGADMFLRKVYRPDDWHHDISVCDPKGQLRVGTEKPFRVAGPLCFAGDYLGRDVSLPADTREGDYILIHDAGAYTFSMWSMYNSRQLPLIVGYEGEDQNFRCLRTRQTLDELVQFWSAEDGE